MSINKTPSGVGLAHENLNRMYYLLPITYYLKIHRMYYLLPITYYLKICLLRVKCQSPAEVCRPDTCALPRYSVD